MNINLGMKSYLWKPLKCTCLECTTSELAFLGAGLKYVCKYVCVYLYIYIYICVCVYICVYIYMYTHTHTQMYMLVAQLCLTLCNPMDCRLPGSSVHGISQARILEWVAIAFSKGSS